MPALGTGDPGFEKRDIEHECDCIPFSALFLCIVFAFAVGVWLTDHLTRIERSECAGLRGRVSIENDRKNYKEAASITKGK